MLSVTGISEAWSLSTCNTVNSRTSLKVPTTRTAARSPARGSSTTFAPVAVRSCSTALAKRSSTAIDTGGPVSCSAMRAGSTSGWKSLRLPLPGTLGVWNPGTKNTRPPWTWGTHPPGSRAAGSRSTTAPTSASNSPTVNPRVRRAGNG